MELSQPPPSGAEDAKSTHDFLSLYSPAYQDPTPSIPGDYLKTQDLLQPLEQDENVSKEGAETSKSSFPPYSPSMVEHIIPGGMGTYSMNHVSYTNQIESQCQKVSKPEGVVISLATQSSNSNNNDENSNCSSYTGSGFMLWEESNVNKGKTGKENSNAKKRHTMREGVMKIGVPWMASMERPSNSSYFHNNPSTAFSSLSSSHPTSAAKNGHVSAQSVQEEEKNDEEFMIKKEPSFHHNGTGSVKVDYANPDRKPNSPRSKHSATEQRRRSKINDRFSKLRGIIPHVDQKRDKASFLLEVIEYIQFLQEKVQKYEDSSQGWTDEQPKTIPLNNRPVNGFIDQQLLPSGQNLLDSNPIGSIGTTKETIQHAQLTNKLSFPDTPPTGPKAQSQLSHSSSCKTNCSIITDKLKDQDLIIESGTISISTIYSQGLSSAVTQALKSLGVDLSQANISVQIDLGKKSKTSTVDSSPQDLMENETHFIDQSIAGSRQASTWEEESGEGFKRLKTSSR